MRRITHKSINYLSILNVMLLTLLHKKNAEHIICSAFLTCVYLIYKLKASDNVILELFVSKVAASVRPTENN